MYEELHAADGAEAMATDAKDGDADDGEDDVGGWESASDDSDE